MISMNDSGIVMPAEWQLESAILLTWPHEETDWEPMLQEITDNYLRIVKTLTAASVPVVIVVPPGKDGCLNLPPANPLVTFFECSTNDTWIRDYGPITVLDHGSTAAVDFKFNGWGLKFAADKDNIVTSRLCGSRIVQAPRINRLSFVLEGGSIESDGEGTILTTSRCLMSPNRNGSFTRQEIEECLRGWLGARQILWLDHGALAGDDTDSHIDTLARLAPGNTIIYTAATEEDRDHYEELMAMASQLKEFRTPGGSPFNLVELPLPSPIIIDGERLPATYCNYLVTPDALFMPTYRQPRLDATAAGILEVAFGLPVTGIDCVPLIRQHGSLHCATMQVPLAAMSPKILNNVHS